MNEAPTPPPRLGVTDPPLPRGRGGRGDAGRSAGRCSQDAGAAPPLFCGSTAPPAATRQPGRVRLSVPGAGAAQATPGPSHPQPLPPPGSALPFFCSPRAPSALPPPGRAVPGAAPGGSGLAGEREGDGGVRRCPRGLPRARPLLPGQPGAAPAATYRGAPRRSRDRPGRARPWSRKGRRSEGRRRARGQRG